MSCCVYVVVNPEGRTCTGQTEDLQRRLAEHNDPQCRLSRQTNKHRGPWRLLHWEECPSRTEAMKRESQLKSGAGRRFIRCLLNEIEVRDK